MPAGVAPAKLPACFLDLQDCSLAPLSSLRCRLQTAAQHGCRLALQTMDLQLMSACITDYGSAAQLHSRPALYTCPSASSPAVQLPL